MLGRGWLDRRTTDWHPELLGDSICVGVRARDENFDVFNLSCSGHGVESRGWGAVLFLLVIWLSGLLGGPRFTRVLPDMWVATGPARIRETAVGVLTTTPMTGGSRV